MQESCVFGEKAKNVLFFSGLALSVTYGDTSPKGRGLGIMIYFAWTAKGSHFGEAVERMRD
ncbi:hypothetical protein CGS54_05595 [Faecalibacterium prausnitzii]|nr:hypothetical protein CGS54_05595 [Faecalibacterium prausnitzii]